MSYCAIREYSGRIIFIAFATAGLSCESEKKPATFYPVDSLISHQVHHLTAIKAVLFKEALLNGEQDTISLIPADTIAWKKELEIFRKLEEINKPVNKENYKVTDRQVDPGSNLMVKVFESLDRLPVVYLKIYYQGDISRPRKLEALYDEQNLLFRSARLLSMRFEQIENKTILTSYSVEGGQKMIFSDSVTFYIGGKVLID